MKQILGHPSWHDVEKGCALLANALLRDRIHLELIIGLTRGGLVPAVILSHLLDVPVLPISYSAKTGKGNGEYPNTLPVLTRNDDTKPSLLVIDDICDSGNTMLEVSHHYQLKGHFVTTGALYFKESSNIRPDYFWQELPYDGPWISFPWEC